MAGQSQATGSSGGRSLRNSHSAAAAAASPSQQQATPTAASSSASTSAGATASDRKRKQPDTTDTGDSTATEVPLVDNSHRFLGQISTVLLVLNPVEELQMEATEGHLTPPPLHASFLRIQPVIESGLKPKESVYVSSDESELRFGAMESRVADVLGVVLGGKPCLDGRVVIRGYVMRLGRQPVVPTVLPLILLVFSIPNFIKPLSEHLAKNSLWLEEPTRLNYQGPEQYYNPHNCPATTKSVLNRRKKALDNDPATLAKFHFLSDAFAPSPRTLPSTSHTDAEASPPVQPPISVEASTANGTEQVNARQRKSADLAEQAERPTKRIKADLPVSNVARRGSETPLDPISESPPPSHVRIVFSAVKMTEAITPFDDNAILAQIISDRRISQDMLIDSSPEAERSWNVKDFFDEIKDGKGRPLKLGHLMSTALDLAGIKSQADLALFNTKLWQTYLLEYTPASLQERFVPLIEEHVENWLSELVWPVNAGASEGMNTFLNGLLDGLGSGDVVQLMAKLGFEDEDSLIGYEEKHWVKLSLRPLWQNDPLPVYKKWILRQVIAEHLRIQAN